MAMKRLQQLGNQLTQTSSKPDEETMAPADSKFALDENGIPPFESLPLGKDDPRFSAWGLYGDKDELGTLNRLTDERVAAAAREEIKTGARVSLNWPLTAQSAPFFNRRAFHHDLYRKHPRFVNDDEWTFNSQSSSQWDGLRHFGYQKEEKFYNGVSMDEVHAVDEEGRRSTVNGIQARKAWQKHGIVGRGILVDYHTWRLEQNMPYDPFARDSIPVADLQACLKAQGTEIKFGDILITRTGFTATHASLPPSTLSNHLAASPQTFSGVAQSEETLRWVWSNFSAVAGDQPSFECWPHRDPKHWMHEVLLAGWGMPIGELFDLEALAAQCKREKRWSFFVVSEPCNVPGGVASPPNILAIF
ncbi:hypothetical protein CLIM01_09799 [Colletotrichum limetticola]|uniref:Cyclase n=1 Tax=Colletotrichum limetticola TaxID=1209924 RepID=A0ABQ9PMT1_9PEZI|nr:hypothetical protein CLIM01_09799 [Colletotrichum limetticola]